MSTKRAREVDISSLAAFNIWNIALEYSQGTGRGIHMYIHVHMERHNKTRYTSLMGLYFNSVPEW